MDDAHDDGSRAALSQAAGGDGGATGAPPDDEAQRYRILSRLGEGGMGEVFVAWDTRLQREVALKRLRGRSDASERRLLDEAALTASLDHPGIVPVYDVLRTASGELSYTMRLVRGRTLRDVLKAPPTMATTTTGAVRLDLVRGLADAAVAVGHAHVRGVLHGDLKPDNILIDDAGHAHVADWGLARRLGDAPVGDGAGTIGYLAPEQRDRGALSPATDVWCLGVILVEVLGGAIDAQGLPTLPASTPAPLASIVARATAPSPSARYGDAAAFAADLRAFLARDVVVAHREHPLERLARVARRARALFTLASAAVVLIAVVIVVATLNLRAERDAARASAREARLERHRANVALARALLVEAFTALEDDRDHDAAVLRDRISALLAARPDDEGRADDVDDDEASVRRDARGLGLALAPIAGAATFSPLPGLADCDVLAPRDGRVALVACRVGAQTSVRAVLPEVKERARVDVAAVAAGFGADRVVLRDGDGALSIVTLDGGGVVSIPGGAVAAEAFLAIDGDVVISMNRARLHLVDGAGRITRLNACGRGVIDDVVQGVFFVDHVAHWLCASGTIERAAPGDRDAQTVATLARDVDAAGLEAVRLTTQVTRADDGSLFLGTQRGALWRRTTAHTLEPLGQRVDLGAITAITILDDRPEGLLAVSGTRGAPLLWPAVPVPRDVHGGASPPTSVRGPFGLGHRGPVLRGPRDDDDSNDDSIDVVVIGVDGPARLRGLLPPTRRLQAPAGLGAVAFVGDDHALVGGGGGAVFRAELARGALRAVTLPPSFTVKQLVHLEEDDVTLVADVGPHGPFVIPDGDDVGVPLVPHMPLRRLGAGRGSDGVFIWGLSYADGVVRWPWTPPWHLDDRADTGALVPLVLLAREGAIDAVDDGAGLVLLLEGGRLARLASPTDTAVALTTVPGATSLAAEAGRVVIGAGPRVLRLGDTTTTTLCTLPGGDRVTALALHGDHVVVGSLRGELFVCRDGDGVRACLPAHRERVGGLAVDPVHHRALSVGWDGRVTVTGLPPP